MEEWKLQVSNITKSFPGVLALDNISFAVKRGSVHVLCGENGAGKSTLMKIINGIYQPDKGEIKIDGKPVHLKSPLQARHHGISMIFQELNYIPEMTVEESLFLSSLPIKKLGNVDWKAIRENSMALLKQEKLSYEPKQKMKDLSISDIQMLEIMKAITNDASVIIMDEPTSAITDREVERLFEKIDDLRKRGTSIIYISHRMDEIFRIADDITVLRDGKVIDTKPSNELEIGKLISLMVGRALTNSFPKIKLETGEDILRVKNLASRGVFKDISFHVRQGEIVGFAGLMGAGRTEVMRALFGLDPNDSGEIFMHDKLVSIRSVRDSIKNKMVMLSEDRKRFGIIPIRSVRENVSLSNLKKFIFHGKLHSKKEDTEISAILKKMNVKTPSLNTVIEALSGGNQQKVVLSKWMLSDPDVLILDEPTRGIDVGAKYEIYKLMSELVQEKKAIIMVSSELPELIGMCDRIYVMAKGEITGELGRNDFSQEAIMKLATGVQKIAGVLP